MWYLQDSSKDLSAFFPGVILNCERVSKTITESDKVSINFSFSGFGLQVENRSIKQKNKMCFKSNSSDCIV